MNVMFLALGKCFITNHGRALLQYLEDVSGRKHGIGVTGNMLYAICRVQKNGTNIERAVMVTEKKLI